MFKNPSGGDDCILRRKGYNPNNTFQERFSVSWMLSPFDLHPCRTKETKILPMPKHQQRMKFGSPPKKSKTHTYIYRYIHILYMNISKYKFVYMSLSTCNFPKHQNMFQHVGTRFPEPRRSPNSLHQDKRICRDRAFERPVRFIDWTTKKGVQVVFWLVVFHQPIWKNMFVKLGENFPQSSGWT